MVSVSLQVSVHLGRLSTTCALLERSFRPLAKKQKTTQDTFVFNLQALFLSVFQLSFSSPVVQAVGKNRGVEKLHSNP